MTIEEYYENISGKNLLSLDDLPFEKWLPIKNFENYYVSNYGRVKVADRKNKRCLASKILKQYLTNKNYYYVMLSRNGKQFNKRVHILVAEAFKPLKDDYRKVVNHIIPVENGICLNFDDNLEWVTQKENKKISVMQGRSPCWMKGMKEGLCPFSKNVLQFSLDGIFIKEWSSIKEASRTLRIDSSGISKCCNGKINHCGGFKWIHSHKS